jgi:hypothetical protein
MQHRKINDDTDSVEVVGKCMAHSGVCANVKSHDESIKELWKSMNALKNMVIVAMGAVILQVLVFGGQVLANILLKH